MRLLVLLCFAPISRLGVVVWDLQVVWLALFQRVYLDDRRG